VAIFVWTTLADSPDTFRMKVRIQSLVAVTFVLVTFALQPMVKAVIPPPDGGYPGFNTAEGQNALSGLTTGIGNTAVGWFSLFSNTDGSFNTALGAGTLLFNLGNQASGEGTQNTAIGTAALLNNTTGASNTATSTTALLNNTTGNDNVATGVRALFSNTTGSSNIAIGSSALPNNTSGNFNIAVGSGAGGAITDAFNCIAIGHSGANVNQSCFIGNIRNAVVAPDAMPVLIDSAGKLGTTNGSSRRFKTQIKPMDQASESILALKPVTFCYAGDNTSTLQFGLIAEDVVDVNPELTVRDKAGELMSVRYDAVNAMLLNEFLKEHRKVQEQESTIEQLKSAMTQQRKDFEEAIVQQQKTTEALVARLNEQEARIQKVSAQVEMRKSGSQMLVENQ
jgi:LysM repeat protein